MAEMPEMHIDLTERYLYIVSRLSKAATQMMMQSIPHLQELLDENNRLYFIGYSYADIPLPKQYEVLFELKNPFDHIITPIHLIFTHDGRREVFHIPYGYGTIAILQFPQGIPEMINNLPEEDHKGQTGILKPIGISSYETWESRLKMYQSGE